jgi:hypothetical protein
MIVAVAFLVSNATVRSLDNNLGSLIDSDFARRRLSFGLRIVNTSQAFVTFAANAPSIICWHYMLVLAHVFISLLKRKTAGSLISMDLAAHLKFPFLYLRTLRQRQKVVRMKSIVFRLDVLVAIVNGDNDIRSNTVHAGVERIHTAFDFRNCSGLRLLPPPTRILATDAVYPIVRILPVGFVYASNLQIHRVFSTSSS